MEADGRKCGGHECFPWRASHHARQRWGARFALSEFDAAYARALLLWSDDNGYRHLVDPETGAEFVVRRGEQRSDWHGACWFVITFVQYRPE